MSWNNSPNSLEQQQSSNITANPTNFDKDYHWGLVNYGEWQAQSVNIDPDNPDYRHNASDFHPAIFAYSLIHKIFSYIGYTLESNLVSGIHCVPGRTVYPQAVFTGEVTRVRYPVRFERYRPLPAVIPK
jgi:hypothetical protein